MNIIGIIAIAFVICMYILISAVFVVDYIIKSKALFDLCISKNIDNAWLSWIPYVKNVNIGALAEQCDSQKGITHRWKIVFVVLTLISVAGSMAFAFIFVAATVAAELGGGAVSTFFAVVLMVSYVGYALIAIATATLNVLKSICVYKIYEWIAPKKALKYILISLLVPFGKAICLYKCSNLIMEDNDGKKQ